MARQHALEVTAEDTLAIFTDTDPRTTAEVAAELGVVPRTAYFKLAELIAQGNLRKKKVRDRAVVWWRPEA